MPSKTSSKTSAKKSTKSTQKKSISSEEVCEVECILDHVRYEEARREYHVNKNRRFETIFTTRRKNNDEYCFLIKWKNYPTADATWESESNCLSMSLLATYKQLNGLPEKCTKIRNSKVKDFKKREKTRLSKPKPLRRTARKKSNATSENHVHEIERILGHVTFEHAYREFFINKNERFGSIFEDWAQNNRINHNKYYYQVKWKNCSAEVTTWECEENCASIGYLGAYKTINGLPKKCIKIRGKPCPIVPGNLLIEEYEKKEKEINCKPQSYGFYPYDEKYNADFGMVRYDDFKCLKQIKYTKKVISTVTNEHQKFVLVERIMEKCNVSKVDSKNFETWQQNIQKEDRSYISSVIQHPNSVKMVDYYFKSSQNARNIVYCYIYEHFEDDLEKKIAAKSMTIGESKKMCFDMLSVLSLLHQYGVHHNVSKNHICVDGDVYKLSHFENFQFRNENRLDEDATRIDIHALGWVLLESLTNEVIEYDAYGSERTLKHKLARLSDVDRSMVSMMLNLREYIDWKSIPKIRFSAGALLQHPWLNTRQNYDYVKCFFLPTYHSEPIEEFLFYQDQDLVETVLVRLSSLYCNAEENTEYQMLLLDDLNSGESRILFIDRSDQIVDVLRILKNMRLVVVPILKANYTEPPKYRSISFVYFTMEFGSVPIIIESAPMNEKAICETVIEQVLPEDERMQSFVIHALIPDHGRLANVKYEMCPKSFIDESLEHKFPESMGDNTNAIPARPPQYSITRKFHRDSQKIQSETAKIDDKFQVLEFLMLQLTGLKRSRFSDFPIEFEKYQ